MFAVTVINFLLFSLTIGNHVAAFIVYIQKALILDIDYPLSERLDMVGQATKSTNVVGNWTAYLPASIKLSLSDLVSPYTRCRYFSAISLSFGGLGLSSQIDGG